MKTTTSQKCADCKKHRVSVRVCAVHITRECNTCISKHIAQEYRRVMNEGVWNEALPTA